MREWTTALLLSAMGILPDGGAVIAYHDSSDPDPLFGVETLLPLEYGFLQG